MANSTAASGSGQPHGPPSAWRGRWRRSGRGKLPKVPAGPRKKNHALKRGFLSSAGRTTLAAFSLAAANGLEGAGKEDDPLTLAASVPNERAIAPVSFQLHDRDPAAFAQALGASFERYGFAVIADHGLHQAHIDAAIADAKAFFALPDSVKRRYRIEGISGQRGYTPFGVETAKGAAHFDLKEFWHVGRDLPPGHPYRARMPDNVWPDEVPRFHVHEAWLYAALEHLGDKVLSAIARYLGLADDFFAPTTHLGNSVLRLLHYPPVPFDGPNVRAGAHEDINTITLLLGAEEAGLELLDRDGSWLPINPPVGSVVCNIGDMLQRLTNHVLPSTTHRVVNPPPERRGVARYSTPFFLHFAPDYLIQTLPGCITPDRPNRYPVPITANDYLEVRLAEIKLK
jgi:isopenicillin N synthase-like dioxygenase